MGRVLPGRLWSIESRRVGHDWSDLACMQACCWCLAWFCIDSILEGSSQVHRVSSLYLHNSWPSTGSRVTILAVSTWVLPGDLLEWVQGRKGLTAPIGFNSRRGAPCLEDCSLCEAPKVRLNPARKREEMSGGTERHLVDGGCKV